MEPIVKHILIIDNDEVTRRLFGSLLGSSDYEVMYANNGEIGREMARRFHPELILLDINMPGGEDGFKTANRIKNEPGSPAFDIPIVLFTSSDLSIEAQKWMVEVGIMDYIQKGVSNDEFIKRINNIFEKLDNKSSKKDKKEKWE